MAREGGGWRGWEEDGEGTIVYISLSNVAMQYWCNIIKIHL